ncbi:MAG: DUF423 domain-containing protein [Rhodothermia bacterium]|nr:DUF423 domain-containing protein [Rhodothermia bacterium]
MGSLAASISVLAGAFGSHALSESLGARADVFETAARYQMYHSIALVIVGLLAGRSRSGYSHLQRAGYLFIAGIVLFSGSLYGLVLLDMPMLGAVTPFGGLSFVAGWIFLALAGWQGRHDDAVDGPG